MKVSIYVLIVFLLIISCIGDKHQILSYNPTDSSQYLYFKNGNEITNIIDLNTISIKEYIKIIRSTKRISKHDIYMIVVGASDSGWVKKNDVPYLMTLVSSEESVPCVMNIFSSQLPNNTSTLGGHAIQLIHSYQLHRPFPLTLTECPSGNSSEIQSIKIWWEKENSKK